MENELEKMILADLEREAKLKAETSEVKQGRETITATEQEQETKTEQKERSDKNPRGAGRHKRGCNCEKCEAKRQGTKPNAEQAAPVEKKASGADKLKSFLDEFPETANKPTQQPTQPEGSPATQQPTQPAQQPAPTVTPLISGYVLLLVTNAIAPAVVMRVMKLIKPDAIKKGQLTAKKIALTKEQRQELEPVANEAAKYIFANMHPVQAFIISAGFIYFGNAMAAIDE